MNKEELEKELKKYQLQMSSHERLKAYLSGQRVDHLPYNIMSLDVVYGYNLGYSIKEFSNIERQIEVTDKLAKEYKIFGISQGLNLRTMAYALGSTGIFPEKGIDRVDKYFLDEKLDVNLLQMPDPYKNKILAEKLANARKLKEKFPDHPIRTFLAGPISTTAALRPLSKLLRDLRKNPEEVKRLLEFCLEANMKWAEVFYKEFGPGKIMIADPVACDDILSPKQAKEFSYPYLKALTSRLRKLNGIKPDLHICGHTKRQWEDLKDFDIEFFSVDNCHDLEECKIAIEDKLGLMGNLPPVDVMKNGTIDDVIDAVKVCIKKGADAKNGYILATGCGTPAETPKENVDAFVYAVRKYSKDARINEMPKALYQ